MARSRSSEARSIELKESPSFRDFQARRRAIQAKIRKRNLLFLSLLLVLLSGLSLALVSWAEAVKPEAQASARTPEVAPGGCTEQRYDQASRRMITVEMRCAAADFDPEGRPIYRGTIKRMDQIGKAFR